MLTDYTTYDDVRSALGVSSDELEDSTLALGTWFDTLLFELEDVNAQLNDTYLDIAQMTSRSAAQTKLFRATRLFSTLAVANALSASLPMFGPKDISDGKAVVSRFADAPYKSVMAKVEKQYTIAKDRVTSAYAELNSSVATSVKRSYMGSTGLSSDPVTGA